MFVVVMFKVNKFGVQYTHIFSKTVHTKYQNNDEKLSNRWSISR